MHKFWTLVDLSTRWRISQRAVLSLVDQGAIPLYYIGDEPHFLGFEIEQWEDNKELEGFMKARAKHGRELPIPRWTSSRTRKRGIGKARSTCLAER